MTEQGRIERNDGDPRPFLLHGAEHKPEKWYTECDCVHPDDMITAPGSGEDWTEYNRLVDEFEDAHIELHEGDDYLGRGCEKSYTDTRCSTCSWGGDYPDVPWPCAASRESAASPFGAHLPVGDGSEQ